MDKFILILCLTLSFNVFAKKEIGMIDLNLILNESNEGKRVKKELERDFNKLSKRLEKKIKEIIKDEEKLKKQSSILSEKATQKKYKELISKQEAFEKMKFEEESNFKNKEEEYKIKMTQKVEKIFEQLIKGRKYKMVIDVNSNPFIYLDPEIVDDLSKELLKKYNKEYK